MLDFLIHWSLKISLLISILTAACSIRTKDLSYSNSLLASPQWLQRKKALEGITKYKISGAFALISDQQKIYVHFNLQQSAPNRYFLLLTNQFGITELYINAYDSIIQLSDSEGKHYTSNDIEKIFSHLIGMDIPVTNIRQWILGLPGNSTNVTIDKNYQLRKLRYKHNGQIWKISIQGYNNKIKPALPVSLNLKQGNKFIKLRINSWTIR